MCERVCRYTREAGVRSLERKIGAICRAVAVKVAEGHKVSRAESPTEQHAGKTGTFFYLTHHCCLRLELHQFPRLCFSRRIRIDGNSLWAKINSLSQCALVFVASRWRSPPTVKCHWMTKSVHTAIKSYFIKLNISN